MGSARFVRWMSSLGGWGVRTLKLAMGLATATLTLLGAGHVAAEPAGHITGHPPVLVWSPFPAANKYMAPSEREFMIDFAVDDLDALIARLSSKGVAILKRDDSDPSGKFAWILDPDGTKIELWQAKTTGGR